MIKYISHKVFFKYAIIEVVYVKHLEPTQKNLIASLFSDFLLQTHIPRWRNGAEMTTSNHSRTKQLSALRSVVSEKQGRSRHKGGSYVTNETHMCQKYIQRPQVHEFAMTLNLGFTSHIYPFSGALLFSPLQFLSPY